MPGAVGASRATSFPLSGTRPPTAAVATEAETSTEEAVRSVWYAVEPGWFETLGAVTAEERDSLARHARVPPPPMDPGLIPHVRPAISGLVRLASGWVGVFPESGEDTGRYLDVRAPTGRHVARVDLQFRLQLGPPAPSWANGTLLGVRQDDLDVQYVVGLDLGVPDLHQEEMFRRPPKYFRPTER